MAESRASQRLGGAIGKILDIPDEEPLQQHGRGRTPVVDKAHLHPAPEPVADPEGGVGGRLDAVHPDGHDRSGHRVAPAETGVVPKGAGDRDEVAGDRRRLLPDHHFHTGAVPGAPFTAVGQVARTEQEPERTRSGRRIGEHPSRNGVISRRDDRFQRGPAPVGSEEPGEGGEGHEGAGRSHPGTP